MSLPTLSPVKTGDTLSLVCVYKQNDVPADLSGFTITSQLRDSNMNLILNFVVTKANQTTDPGVFTLSTASNPPSPALPIDVLQCDIQFVTTASGVIRSSQTFYLPVEPEVTIP
jgi:hypothetical protein